MTANEVRERILGQLEAARGTSCDCCHTPIQVDAIAAKVMNPPIRRKFKPSWSEETEEHWLVYVEHPETDEGYRIVTNDSCDEFGLAVGKPGEQVCTFLGFNEGSFVDTILEM